MRAHLESHLSIMIMLVILALLSPFYQSIKEAKAILEDPLLAQQIPSGETLISLERVDGGYVCTFTHFTVRVDVEYQPNATRAGPRAFLTQFHEKVLRE